MKYKKLQARVGDSLRISDLMSLKFEKFSEDLSPVWHEVPPEPQTNIYDDGSFVEVTDDCWFVFDKDHWRMMTSNEHTEASRQVWHDSQ